MIHSTLLRKNRLKYIKINLQYGIKTTMNISTYMSRSKQFLDSIYTNTPSVLYVYGTLRYCPINSLPEHKTYLYLHESVLTCL